MEIPSNNKYTKDHEWIKVENDASTVGITSFAQDQLGEVVYIDLPKVGKTYSKGDVFCVVESTKAASDVYAPVTGEVVAVNDALVQNSSLINQSPYTEGWIAKMKITNPDEVNDLLDASGYSALIK